MAGGGIEGLVTKADLERFIGESVEKDPIPMSGVDGLTAALQPGQWQPLNLLNAWVAYGGEFAPPACRTIPGSNVQIRGFVKSGSNNTAIATLPASMRPKYRHVFAVINGGGNVAGQLEVWADGQIVYQGGASPAEYVGLDVIVPVGG